MRLGWIALLLLAGCATPGDVRSTGERSEFALALPPGKAVSCIRRNAQEVSSMLITEVHENEVIVRNSEQAVAVAEVYSVGTGSRAIIWRNTGILTALTGPLPAAMAKGC